MKCCLFNAEHTYDIWMEKFKSVSLRKRFHSSKGGNHLDQSVLWHRDVITLLMSLSKITCDLVAGSFHSIVSKSPLSTQNGKHLHCLDFQQKKRETPRGTEGNQSWREAFWGCVAFCGASLVYQSSFQGQLSRWPGWYHGRQGRVAANQPHTFNEKWQIGFSPTRRNT